MKNIFEKNSTDELIERIQKLTPETQRIWGKMDVAQMLAHCSVAYESALENKHPNAKGLKKWLLVLFVKPMIVGDKPYKHNSPTSPEFKIVDAKEFEQERKRLIAYMRKTQELGADYFDGKMSNSFGKLTQSEWSKLFYKHLDHHLNQFGV
ncbi:MAG: DUF1569 domain-containing protein [Crocinitomicaceae bacterium]